MIFKTYGRRGRGYADGVSNSSSQEFSQDVYDFACPSDFKSSRQSRQLPLLPPRKGGDRDREFRIPKNLKMIKFDSKAYGTKSSRESKKFGNMRISDGDSQKPKKLKEVCLDPYDYNSSQELEAYAILPQRRGRDTSVFDFSEDVDKWESKKSKNVDSKSLVFNSSQELCDLGISQSRKRETRGAYRGFGMGSGKSKTKDRSEINPDSYDYNSSQEMEQLVVLPQSRVRDTSIFDFSEDGDIWESKKFKNVDSNSLVLNSSQELGDLGISQSRKRETHGASCSFGMVSVKSKTKDRSEIIPDPYDYNSSQELEELVVLPQRKVRGNSIFDFSEDGDLWESKKSKNIGSDSYVSISSQDLGDLGTSQSRKLESDRHCWNFDGVSGKMKKNRDENGFGQKKPKNKKNMKSKASEPCYIELTATLMETQESGEMMKHEDEVNFALDGLKKGQPVRIRRASLLSLLSICGAVQQRRHLKIHGMAKTIVDAVLALSFDDMPSNLAAAALVYITTIDGQDDHLLDSPNCIHFLIKLLKPFSPSAVKEKALPVVGSKLLSLCKNASFLQESAKGTDSSGAEIMLKVREILVNCKEMKPKDDGAEEPELNPKWISLLTMEKACSSSISIEDTYGIRKTGGKFKEKLREFGGLDAVFEVTRKCHSVMEKWLEKSPTFAQDSRDILGLESLVLLLKCLKIMENALFLSNDNQRHLLVLRGDFDGQSAPRSFTKLVLNVIKILSGVSLLRRSCSEDERICDLELNSQESFTQINGHRVDYSSQAALCSGTSSDNSGMCPFAFDELSQDKYESHSVPLSSQQESNDVEIRPYSQEADEYKSNLLADCLLTAVKVLMNLTNENPEGCQQIATCGGLEILSSLIAGHFSSSKPNPKVNQRTNTPHSDGELDFLVALLGLLVNLVEKDDRNRSRLAAATVSLQNLDGSDSEDQSDVIFLLCSIFLANQGTNEETLLSLEDEESILQGEKEAEKMIVEAYAALLLAFLSTESQNVRNSIAECLPNHNLKTLVPVLERFLEFHMTLNMISPETHAAVLEVVESCRIP